MTLLGVRLSGERGSATVLGLGVILLLLSLLATFLMLAASLQASLQARAAADSAALAGAAVILEGGDLSAACTAAGELAQANGARLEQCAAQADGENTTAVLTVSVGRPVAVLDGLVAHATARAGAVPEQDR